MMGSSSKSAKNSPPSSHPGSRSATPRPGAPPPPTGPTNDHTVSDFRHRLSQREYPADCPPLNVRWYHAVDVPKRKPFSTGNALPAKKPSKFVPFTPHDSKAIEASFQKLASEEDEADVDAYTRHGMESALGGDFGDMGSARKKEPNAQRNWKVPVHEDYLFDVDIKTRELAPVYWLGPVYEVLRGTWFYQEGSTLRPCNENLATQIEEGYLKIKPWRSLKPKSPAPDTAAKTASEVPAAAAAAERTSSIPFLGKSSTAAASAPTPQPLQTWRLFGAHLNSFVVFADANTAWLLTDDYWGKLSATVWQRITAGTHMGGTKIVRGFTEAAKTPEKKNEKEAARSVTPPPGDQRKVSAIEEEKRNRRKTMPPPRTSTSAEDEEELSSRRALLHRKMSSYTADDDETQEEKLEAEIKEDYRTDQDGDEQGREIEHLILVTHGIGQKLGMRMENVNFVHDVNVMRKSMKAVYGVFGDLQALNGELESEIKNCRIQCLPVCWRHKVEFPKLSLRHNRAEHDLSSGSTSYEDEYPSLEDITVDGVPTIRNLMTDLALDVLLYQSQTYREVIIEEVRTECNRIYALFRQRNPGFRGKVSFVGHSLGSAIFFDILCRQPEGFGAERQRKRTKISELDFPVENYFGLGSPVGIFEMLNGRTIASRDHLRTLLGAMTGMDGDFPSDPFCVSQEADKISSPKVKSVYNIYHPSDPVSYRLEPLVSKAMAQLKVQPLPYKKRSLFSSNGQIVGGISEIGQSVTRGVSSIWSSLSSTLANSMVNRALGFDGSSTPPNSGTTPDDKRNTLLPVEGQHPATAIDHEIETLYSGFQKRRKAEGEDGAGEGIEEAGRLRREEEKVRALNATGRIDFAIQEGVFDISLIASIASHLSYWGDEDVNHFIISQLLSRQRVIKRQKSSQQRAGGPSSPFSSGWSIDDISDR